MDEAAERELDTIALRILQRRGLYAGFVLKDYQFLKNKERIIARSKGTEIVPLEEAILDLNRNGADETQLMPKAFLSSTSAESRNTYRFGYQELIVYFAVGTYLPNPDWELGLISSHMPGSPGGGGWGLNGTRKLQLAQKPLDKHFNWENWIKSTLAWAYEHYDGKIYYISNEDESFATLLRMAIGLARVK